MRTAVITFPGSNCDRDLADAFERQFGRPARRVWHTETHLDDVDLVGVPGGFAHGDYLRCGAIAARSPVMREVARLAERGVGVLGVCNGFQILCEAGLLPGALVRNEGQRFICRWVHLQVATHRSRFTCAYAPDREIRLPVAHHDGNYIIDPGGLKRLQDEDRIAFRYREPVNGATDRIAGILSTGRNVLGIMPHPERACDPLLGGTDGAPLLASVSPSAD